MRVKNRNADLDCYPTVRSEKTHVCLGDLHGNTLKLLFFLIEEGILLLSREQYELLHTLYTTDTRYLRQQHLDAFKDTLDNTFVALHKSVVLIGDELADRGLNDYFTLLVLKKIYQAGVDVEILLSNHGLAFINYYQGKPLNNVGLGLSYIESLAKMDLLVQKGLVQQKEIKAFVETCYMPMLRLFTYSLSPENELTLYSHAPVGLETVRGLIPILSHLLSEANKENKALLCDQEDSLSYQDDTIDELILSINKMNEVFFSLLRTGEIMNAYNEEVGIVGVDRPVPIEPIYALSRLVWNRHVDSELTTKTANGVSIAFVHGHIGGEKRLHHCGKSHYNLDTNFGKCASTFQTSATVEYRIRVSDDLSALKWKNRKAQEQIGDLVVSKERFFKPSAPSSDSSNHFDQNLGSVDISFLETKNVQKC